MSIVRDSQTARYVSLFLHSPASEPLILRFSVLYWFFKTILDVKGTIEDIIKYPSWQRRPVRFLGVDLTLVGGVDMSLLRPSFVSIARCLRRMLCLSFVGSSLTRQLAALQSVSVLGEEFVELFTTCNDHGM